MTRAAAKQPGWTSLTMVRTQDRSGFDPTPRGSIIFTRIHEHTWRLKGTSTSPNGSVRPVYECTRCGDCGWDTGQQYGGTDPDTGRVIADTRTKVRP